MKRPIGVSKVLWEQIARFHRIQRCDLPEMIHFKEDGKNWVAPKQAK